MKSVYRPTSLTTTGYLWTVVFQMLLLVADVVINELVQWSTVRKEKFRFLLAFIFQDVFLILAAIVLGHTMFRTHVFKAGFVRVLLKRFKFAIFFTCGYMILTIVYQIATLALRWLYLMEHVWPDIYSLLFVTHRVVALLYYYFYKRAALRLSDARYYDEEWVKHSFAH